ncbi:hypothetical protein [Colwellia sp. C1TZA3]|uniref:hypothetical protein n=1 Tax=Colwellia sp. C1TZA3 TaxID=2508879 RepID=UPI0011B9F92C|nr:hypothetical protein [Colwellia sp. C1TZA3]TWX69119.1 hypothetical protein ESZ39_11795 [Colwellia sp. C1TZA3]
MITSYSLRLLIKGGVALVLAHIPLLLLYMGFEIFPIVIWVGLLENLPQLFLDVNSISWFEVGEFGIMSYTWEGFIISFICKYIVFLFFIILFDMCVMCARKK